MVKLPDPLPEELHAEIQSFIGANREIVNEAMQTHGFADLATPDTLTLAFYKKPVIADDIDAAISLFGFADAEVLSIDGQATQPTSRRRTARELLNQGLSIISTAGDLADAAKAFQKPDGTPAPDGDSSPARRAPDPEKQAIPDSVKVGILAVLVLLVIFIVIKVRK